MSLARTLTGSLPLLLSIAGATALPAQRTTPHCSHCAEWNTPQEPFRICGNTYYAGPHGIRSILITSPARHILIDGAIAESPCRSQFTSARSASKSRSSSLS